MLRTLFLTIGVLLALPGLAHAAGTAQVQGDTLVFTGTEGVDKVIFDLLPTTGQLAISPVNGPFGATEVGPGCVFENQSAICQGAGVTKIVARTGGGVDDVRFDIEPTAPVTKTVDTGAGDDRVEDAVGGGTFALGDGDDEALAKGASTIDGGDGDDALLCGDRNAETRLRAVFTLDGGLGEDRICGGLRDDRIEGGAADDKIFSGEGDDRIEGGSGDDQISAGDDDDRINPGRGEDEVAGGAGKDTIRAKDGDEDDLSCGSKRDTVFADRIDLLSRCETIRR